MLALIAILGPLKGTQIPIGDDEISIGRDHTNQLPIPDLLLSRRHCVIRKNGEEYVIRDLDSRNGVFVNSIPVGERTLQHGDQVEIGNSLFVFTAREEEWKQFEELSAVDAFVAKSTISLRIGDPLQITPDSHDLTLLLRISHSVNSVQNIKEMSERLLELMFDSIPAQRAAIFLYIESATEFNHVCSLWRKSRPDAVQVSRSLLMHVVENKAAFLANDVLQNEQVKKTDSLLAASPHSVICAPFVLFDQVLGLLYLDTFDPQYKFDEHHLQLAGAIAGLAAPAIRNIQNYEAALEASRNLRAELQMDREIVGESSAIRKVYDFVRRTAPADSTILITGESGTGKELVARALHANSPRSEFPFVAINCAALPESLLESELFGHEKGAFTGALIQKKGKLEAAEGGTIFLDEVGEMAMPLQAKLLRALQEREIERVGSTRPVKVNIRVVAATNQDLQKGIQEGTFRQDLFYRLNVLTLRTPALRDMREDIPLLARYFVSRFSKKAGRPLHGISQEALQYLQHYDWPGNVRELENAIERAVVMGSSDLILPEDLPASLTESEPAGMRTGANYQDSVNKFKQELVLKAFEGTNSNYNEAATRLGVHPNYLYRLVRNLGLKDRV
ncbi:sigma 54-interacting transcriptional regulator [bacterium]|nr:sigma 54-interacting transcriptional regulator [bacterium]